MASNFFYERSATARAIQNEDLNSLGDVVYDSPEPNSLKVGTKKNTDNVSDSETKLKSASSKERFRSPNIIFDSDDSEDSADEESLYSGEYLKTNTSVSTKLISSLQFRNQPISKSKSDSSAEDASSAQMHNIMLKNPAPKSAGKKSVKNIVRSGDKDETYFSPERSHNQLPYEKEEDVTKNVGALSISTDRRESLQSRNYPTQPFIATISNSH